MPDIAYLLLGGVAQWLIYTGLLWCMIKIQKMNYNLLGLLASSAAATLVEHIPFAGFYLSFVVLVIGLRKCTRADIAPDILFTVGIAGAFMFCVNLWLLGSLMGDLRPDFGAAKDLDVSASELAEETTLNEESDEAPEASRTAIQAKPQKPVKSARDHPQAKQIALKGIAFNPSRPLAMIGSGTQNHTVAAGEAMDLRLNNGLVKVRCEQITRSAVLLSIEGETVELRLH
jgi:hypothetical protein